MPRKQKAFTLIELMVVVAVIAILATLGITNFSSAIQKARDAKRLADIQAVAKALETCYDISSGKYNSSVFAADTSASFDGKGGLGIRNAPDAWVAQNIDCLGSDVKPAVDEYPYYLTIDRGESGIDNGSFCACAMLEEKKFANGNASQPNCSSTDVQPGEAIGAANKAYYCVESSQGSFN